MTSTAANGSRPSAQGVAGRRGRTPAPHSAPLDHDPNPPLLSSVLCNSWHVACLVFPGPTACDFSDGGPPRGPLPLAGDDGDQALRRGGDAALLPDDRLDPPGGRARLRGPPPSFAHVRRTVLHLGNTICDLLQICLFSDHIISNVFFFLDYFVTLLNQCCV